MRTRIAACSPKRCSCRAVACGDRGVSCDMGRRPLVRRRWRHGSPFPACQGMPPPVPRAPRSPRQFRLRSRTPVVPSCPASFPKVSRSCRPAVFDAHAAGAYGPAHGASVDSPPSPEMRRRGQSVPDTGASPRRLRNAVASRKRHLGVVSRKLRLPRPRRIPADCPVARSGRDGSRPTAPGRPQTAGNIHLAPRRHQKRMFSSLAAIALQRRLAPRHYRFAAAATASATGSRAVVTGRMPHLLATGTPAPSPDARTPVRFAHSTTSRRRPLRSPTRARPAPK